ncbi:MAG: hypothetical protein HYX71_09160 [Opitutae bacterium]|nr:hypothetical protein [Opitutae bacterium]
MNIDILQVLFALGAVLAALAVAVVGGVGMVVWLAGGKMAQGKDRKTAWHL